MMPVRPTIRRNLFEVDNARALSALEVARTFVPTQTFWRLLSPENHIVVGARGSGKTALAKMLSHEHLALSQDNRAKEIISSKSLVGTYIPTRLEWVGALRNKPWQSLRQQEEFFAWRLNVASCLAFLRTVRSCLDVYFHDIRDRALAEQRVVRSLAEAWLTATPELKEVNSVSELQRYLRRVEYIRQRNHAMARAQGKAILEMPDGTLGVEFATDLFAPFQYGTHVLGELIDIPDESRFMVVIDEAEFLDEAEQRILNSFFRTHGGNSVFKMTTMPYKHLTLETNAGEDLRERHDFEYIYVDQDPIVDMEDDEDEDKGSGRGWEQFARMVFNKRAEISGSRFSGLNLDSLLGQSVLLDPQPGDWSDNGQMRTLMEKHCDEETILRARQALREIQATTDPVVHDHKLGAFSNTIARKLRGALLLREAVAEQKGAAKLDIYSGVSMVVRCADGNPRHLVTIFNSMLRRGAWRNRKLGRPLISARRQTDILLEVSDSVAMRTQAVREVGAELYKFIDDIGNNFRRMLHEQKLSTDTYLSIEVEQPQFRQYGAVIRAAVSYGLLHVTHDSMKHALPTQGGRFRLAYILSPHYRLLPRRGRSRPLERVLTAQGRLEF